MITNTEQVLKMKARYFVDPNVPRAPQTATVRSIIDNLQQHNRVFVVDERDQLIGIVSDQDVVEALKNADQAGRIKSGAATVAEIMTPLEPTQTDTVARDNEPLQAVIDKLSGKNSQGKPFRAVPVVNAEGNVIGQVTRGSIQTRLTELLGE
ncbi:MAG TPA: CBS domain-containing protein [Anaerolineae bacterium]|nr:CBS domain-containing protein [Anaerolineae bacterium]